MADYEKRFAGFNRKEVSGCIAELEAQALVHGARLLSTEEVEELLLLLPAKFFKVIFRIQIREIARRAKDYSDKLGDLDEAVEKLAQECGRLSDEEEGDARDEIVAMMENLRLSDPALWFRVYQKVRTRSLSVAIELEAWDKEKPFEKP